MSIISYNAAQAFKNKTTFRQSNTICENGKMWLHGNKILWHDESGAICFSLCGWDTLTTCSRLRAAGLPINHKKGVLYIGTTKIDDWKDYKIVNNFGDEVQEL